MILREGVNPVVRLIPDRATESLRRERLVGDKDGTAD